MILQNLLDQLYPYLISVLIDKELKGVPVFNIMFHPHWIVQNNVMVNIQFVQDINGKKLYKITSNEPDKYFADDIVDYILFIIEKNKDLDNEKKKMEEKLLSLQENISFDFFEKKSPKKKIGRPKKSTTKENIESETQLEDDTEDKYEESGTDLETAQYIPERFRESE
jgi:hypothetical protein